MGQIGYRRPEEWAGRAESEARGHTMGWRGALIRVWVLCSVLFIAFIAARDFGSMKREFELASTQQRLELERTKEKAAPLYPLFRLSVLAIGVPLTALAIGLGLIWIADRVASPNSNGETTQPR
jgi:hypothetical protein